MNETHTNEREDMDHADPTIWDKVGIAAVSLLLAAFVMSVAAPVIANASTSDAAKRDDKAAEVVAVEDDDEDDDLARDGNSGKNSGNGDGSKKSRDKTGNTTRGDKSDKTGKNTGNGKDTRTGKNSGGKNSGGQDSGNEAGDTGDASEVSGASAQTG